MNDDSYSSKVDDFVGERTSWGQVCVEGTTVVEETGVVWRHVSPSLAVPTQTVKERRVLFVEWFEIV